jgi:hypothetical protein
MTFLATHDRNGTRERDRAIVASQDMATYTTIRAHVEAERNAEAFRLAIVGWELLEEALNQALGDFFGGTLPGEIRQEALIRRRLHSTP